MPYIGSYRIFFRGRRFSSLENSYSIKGINLWFNHKKYKEQNTLIVLIRVKPSDYDMKEMKISEHVGTTGLLYCDWIVKNVFLFLSSISIYCDEIDLFFIVNNIRP